MTVGKFSITEPVYNEIVAHAREGKLQEVCGILRGRGSEAFELVRARNVAPDPISDYVVDSQTLLRQFDFEEEGDAMVGIYHSHPISPAYPSATDAWNAFYPDCAYLICSLADDAAPVVRAFRLTAHDVTPDLAELCDVLDFDETRPGLFAYYQAGDAPVPFALMDIHGRVPAPFYVVFESSEGTTKGSNSRVISVLECEIQITPG